MGRQTVLQLQEPQIPSFRVTWTIDVEGDDEVDAAEEARRYQRLPGAKVSVFDVIDEAGRKATVDLDARCVRTQSIVNVPSCDHRLAPTRNLQQSDCGVADPCRLCPRCCAEVSTASRKLSRLRD